MTAQTKKAPPAVTLLSLLGKYRPLFARHQRQIALGVIALFVTNLLGVAIPWFIKQAVDTVQQIFIANGPATGSPLLWQTFYQSLWIIAGLALAVLISRVTSRIFLLGAGRKIEYDIRNRLYGHLLKMPPSYYAAHPPGELMSRMTNDVDATKFLTGGGIMLSVNTLLAYGMTIPMMLYLNWRLALITFLFYPLVIFLMSRISKRVRQGYYDVQEVLAEISTVAQENLNGMAVIQSYVKEAQENRRFQAICNRYFETYTRLIHERILLFMILAALSGISMLLVLLVGGWQVIAGQLDWGGFVAFTMYLEHIAWPTMALGWTISIFQQGTAALQRIDEVLSTEPSIRPEKTAPPETPSAFRGQIEIRHLTFAYRNPYAPEPETVEKPVLQDITLSVRPGETVALVGPVGSGKSTLLRLLPRLLEVPEGHVFLDGQDITQLDPGLVRQLMVLMPQLSFLFSTTVSQNIAFGQPDMLEQEEALAASIVPVAQLAGVHRDILDLPQQYQTLVGERGLMLSGGQRQRVALARTIMMDAPVLILDDPFSNIDADTERQIVEALRLRRTFEKRTTLLATHRFSLVALCDRVVLMDQGRIVATGTHAQLLKEQPLYRKLHRLEELRASLDSWAIEPDGHNASPDSPLSEVMEGR